MNYATLQDAEELKLALQNMLFNDTGTCLDELQKVVKSSKQSDILLLKMQLRNLQKDQNLGLTTSEQLRVLNAQLAHRINGYIDYLKEHHFKPATLTLLGTDITNKPQSPTTFIPTERLHSTEPLVALLIFANDTEDPLGNLREEERAVQLALQHFKKAGGNIEVITISSVNELFNYFTLYKGQIGLIHYGGHASGKGLQIDGTLANAEGIANLMGTEPNLQFVFLNGCATKDQVKLLQENKVKTVIATAVPINDRKATDFAVRFYQNLTYFNGENTLEAAFLHAKAFVETTEVRPVTVGINRGFIMNTDKPLDTFQWELFEHPDFEGSLDWKLPKTGVKVLR